MPKHPNTQKEGEPPLRAPLSPLIERLRVDPAVIERTKRKFAELQLSPDDRQTAMERVFGTELTAAMNDLATGTHEARQRVAAWRRGVVERMANDGAPLIVIAAAIGCSTSWTGELRERLRLEGRVP